LDRLRPNADLALTHAHAVTAELRAALPGTDDEGLEYAAQSAAADDCLTLLATSRDAPRLRVVVAADVEAAAPVPGSPTVVVVRTPVSFDQVACVLVDEPEAARDVAAAAAGDPQGLERLEERDLLWYDVSEIGFIPGA